MKLSLLSSDLSEETQKQIEKYARKLGHESFNTLLHHIKDSLNEEMPDLEPKIDPELNTSWMGARYGIEVPSPNSIEKKDLGVELMDRRFMWCDDYFHYNDWGQKLKDAYDGFNLYVKAPKDIKSDEKYFYQDGWRRTPTGVFPDGKGRRELAFPKVKDDFKQDFASKLYLVKQRNFTGDIAGKDFILL